MAFSLSTTFFKKSLFKKIFKYLNSSVHAGFIDYHIAGKISRKIFNFFKKYGKPAGAKERLTHTPAGNSALYHIAGCVSSIFFLSRGKIFFFFFMNALPRTKCPEAFYLFLIITYHRLYYLSTLF